MNASFKMPLLGVGTYRLMGDIAYQSVINSLELGYRHIDTAQVYGNEIEVGNAIRDSGIPRDELFITTKVWNNNLSQEDLVPSVNVSLEKLGVESVDLLLVHWPFSEAKAPMREYMAEMRKAKDSGLTHHIGVSNFTIAHLQEALELLPANEIYTNQVEVHPYLTNQKLRNFCYANGINVTGYMPFAVGKVLKDPLIIEIAEKYNASTPEVVLAWVFAHGMATIPSSTKRENLALNLKGLKLVLSAEDVARIDTLNCHDRQAKPIWAPKWDE